MLTFGDDLEFLRQHNDVILLASGDAQVAVVAAYQGRVMTSTSGGLSGLSFGWLNREHIAAAERVPHINVFGGEDRFWLGPEGGQFSIFFKGDDAFDLEHWQTPEPIDWGAWDVTEEGPMHARFRKSIELVNYSGTTLALDADRTVRLLDEVDRRLDIELGNETKVVAFESENTITNSGDKAWSKETGLLSIWILGMFNPSPSTTIVIPFVEGAEATLGPIVNDAYFGKVPGDRLRQEPGVMFFRGDGAYRGKIGVSRRRAVEIVGSYDAESGVLTLVHYSLLEGTTDYVNSMWEIQDEPFAGDVVNSYNDGPPEPGAKPLGPFYELETSSAAAELAPGESLTHVHQTFHFQGPVDELDAIAQTTLGVSIEQITAAFSP
ncbi:MAG: hypothetical protein E2P02_06260 [Acidobacteria bacterium]|nr:MAG: hypothetical protein E2P02_06260 [Acidobacteriota bacterium]